MKSFVPKCAIHQYGTFPYSTTILFRVNPSDAVEIILLRVKNRIEIILFFPKRILSIGTFFQKRIISIWLSGRNAI